MKHQDHRTLRHPLVLIVLYFLFFIDLPGGVPPTLAGLPADLSIGIGTLAEYKSNAEQQAQILVRLAADGDITKDDYLKGQSLYAQAKAGFDGWIDQLAFEIKSGTINAPSPSHEAMQEKAKINGDIFTKYVQAQLPKIKRRGEFGRTFRSFFASIKDVVISIATGIAKASPAEQRAVIKQLKEYKWSEFHIIEARQQFQSW
jgi:NAD(P)-dependent dehydrogenase (short-subunit alcohol dehydrogenase family)